MKSENTDYFLFSCFYMACLKKSKHIFFKIEISWQCTHTHTRGTLGFKLNYKKLVSKSESLGNKI